jgi:alpha-L-arabinofuranosidase
VPVSLKLAGGAKAGKAEFTMVAPGSPNARNDLDAPRAVAPVPGRTRLEQGAVHFEMPPLSVGVVTVRLP